jgi:imidazolonepropionase-like amidohydrolase
VDGIEHCTCFTAAGMVTPPELAERIAAARIPVCPTVGRHLDAPIPPRIQEMLERTGLTWERRVAQVGELHRAGVRLISGGDSGINPAKPHGILPVAVADLVAAGMSPAAAPASTTGAAADACRLAGRTGRLRPGLAADLLVVDGNPLRDIGALRAVRTVVARGRETDPGPA